MARYEITKDNEVLVYYNEQQEAPGLLQPFDPADETNTPFASKAAAKAWADAHLKSLEAPAPLDEETPAEEPTPVKPEA